MALGPTCYIMVNDTDSTPLDIYYYDNSSNPAVWELIDTDLGVPRNDTYNFVFTNADTYNTRYWWRVMVNDTDGNNISEIYTFTTTQAPTDFDTDPWGSFIYIYDPGGVPPPTDSDPWGSFIYISGDIPGLTNNSGWFECYRVADDTPDANDRYDVDPDGDVDVFDASATWSHRLDPIADYYLFDTEEDNDIDVFDCSLIWQNRD